MCGVIPLHAPILTKLPAVRVLHGCRTVKLFNPHSHTHILHLEELLSYGYKEYFSDRIIGDKKRWQVIKCFGYIKESRKKKNGKEHILEP